MYEQKIATGSGALDLTHKVPYHEVQQLLSVTLHLSAAPTTSENFTITLDSGHGGAFDTLLYSLDLSTASTVNLVWQPDAPLYLFDGDAVDVKYANTDAGVFGVTLTCKAV